MPKALPSESGPSLRIASHDKHPWLALVSSGIVQGAIDLYDVASNKLISSIKLKTNEKVSFLRWISLDLSLLSDHTKKRRKKDSINGWQADVGPVLIAGLENGDIIAIDPNQSRNSIRLSGSGQVSPVTSIDLLDSKFLVCGHQNNTIVCWNIETRLIESQMNPSVSSASTLSVIAVKEPLLFYCTSSLYIHDIKQNPTNLQLAPLQKEINLHTSSINDIIVTEKNGQLYLITSASQDRYILITSLSDEKFKVTSKISLLAEANVKSMFLSISQSHLFVLNEKGEVEIFSDIFNCSTQSSPKKKSNAPKKSSAQILLKEEDTGSIFPIEHACELSKGAVILFSYRKGQLVSQLFDYESQGGLKVTGGQTLYLSNNSKGLGTKSKSTAYSEAASINITADASKKLTNSSQAALDASADIQINEDNNSDEEISHHEVKAVNGATELTFADKLEALQKEQKNQMTITESILSDQQSLAKILNQALRTSDNSLLETCLRVSDKTVIETTVFNMDPKLAMVFLDAIADRLARKPIRSKQLLPWIRLILIRHGGYLRGIPTVSEKLANLQTILSNRSSNLEKLIALQGRLEMIFAQVAMREASQGKVNADNIRNNCFVFNEDEEDAVMSDEEVDEDFDSSEDGIDEDAEMTIEDYTENSIANSITD